jgi:uncharacterized protein (TIGR02246 family)
MTSLDADHDDDLRAIHELEREYDAAWNRGDAAYLASLYHREAVVVNPLGEVSRGQGAIRAALEAFLLGAARDSKHFSSVTRISRVGDHVAVVDGEARLEGILIAGSQSTVAHSFTDIVVKDGPRWVLAHTRAYVFATSP